MAALAGSWLLGRLGILGAGVIGPVWAMAADLIFPIALCAVIANMLIRAGNRRNYGFIALLGGAALANLCWHLELADLVTWEGDISGAEVAQQLMLNLLLLIVAIVGGRVIPMFSANWLRRQGQTLAMRHPVWLQRLCITGLVLVTVAELLGPIIDDRLLGALALATGLAYWFRLSGWNGHKTWAHPLVWILHLAYFWVGLALLLKGGQYLIDIPAVAARHAAAMGAVGSMIMAIMPRVSLGHTGRELILPRPMLVAYALILAAPILRVASPFVEADWYQVVLLGSGMCWTAAFGIFIWCFAPMLFKPRAT